MDTQIRIYRVNVELGRQARRHRPLATHSHPLTHPPATRQPEPKTPLSLQRRLPILLRIFARGHDAPTRSWRLLQSRIQLTAAGRATPATPARRNCYYSCLLMSAARCSLPLSSLAPDSTVESISPLHLISKSAPTRSFTLLPPPLSTGSRAGARRAIKGKR